MKKIKKIGKSNSLFASLLRVITLMVLLWSATHSGDLYAQCATTGTLLFREDFGGNSTGNADFSSTGLPTGTTTYGFTAQLPQDQVSPHDGYYSLAKRSIGGNSWHSYDDHTIAGTDRGYFMFVNANQTPGLFYTTTLTGLCANLNLYFSAWIGNAIKSSYTISNIKPKLRFELRDPNNNSLLASQSTGDIPTAASPTWTRYGISFNTGSNSSVKLMIYNEAAGGVGNDLLLDDIEVYLCAPTVNLTSPTVAESSVCPGTSFTFAGSYIDNNTFGNALSYRWEKSATGSLSGSWATVLGTAKTVNGSVTTANSTYIINPVTASDEGYYRLVVSTAANINSVNCRAMSNIVHLTVKPAPTLNSVTSKTICSGTSVGYTATSATTGTSFSLARTLPNGISASGTANTGGNINETLTNGTTDPIDVTYTVTLTGTNGCTNTQNVVITVRGKLAQAAPTAAQTICYNTAPDTIRGGAVSGGATPYTYQWQSSPNGTAWSDITPNGTLANYKPSALTATTHYRRIVTSSASCGKDTSNTVTVTVNPDLTGGTISSDKSICHNASPGQLTSSENAGGGTGTRTYQWEYRASTGAGTWSDWDNVSGGSGATTAEYTPGNLTATTQYRRKATNDCGSVNSNTITVTVHGQLTGGTIDSDKSICHNASPGQLSSSAAAGGGTGTRTYQWEYRASTGAGTWSDWDNVSGGSGATTAEYTPGNLTVTTQYRRKATNDCGSVNSNTITVTVHGQLTGGTIDSNKSICHNASPGQLTSSENAGGGTGTRTYQWEYRASTGAGTWSDWDNVSGGSGATTAEYTPGNLTVTTQYRRKATNTCGDVNSNTVTVTVYGKLNQGAAQENQAICYNTVPNTLLGGAPGGGSGSSSYSYQWQQSNNDGATWTDVSPDGTSPNYSPPALTQTLKYRRIVSSDGGSCGRDTSNVLTVKVYPQAILNYPDFRIWACPGAPGSKINLSKYLDTIEAPNIVWGAAAGSPAINASTGIIDADNLLASKTYTYIYTVTNPCIVGSMTRKIYLKMLGSNGLKQPQDTVTVCYETAEAVNINQIFGIDAGGTWMYSSPDGNISAYVTESAGGAVIMNGKGIYTDTSITFDGTTGNTKRVVFTYKSDNNSCLGGKTYRMVIILTPDMM